MARKNRRKSMADSLGNDDDYNVDVLSEKVKLIHSKEDESAQEEPKKEEEPMKRFTFDIEESIHAAFKMHVIGKKSNMRERLIYLIEKDLNGEID